MGRESRAARPAGGPRRFRWLAAALILGSALARLAYLAVNCPLDLAPDEAHYWDWSRHPDWSYYSKGPLVAWLVRASCAALGSWSQATFGSQMFAVRVPAVICGCLLLAGAYVLTVQVYRRERLALAVVALGLTLPPLAAGSLLMTIDAPYTCCWCWALVFGHQAVLRRSAWAWPAAGLAVAMGVMAKYTMALWLPSVGLFLLSSPGHRRLLARPGFWVMTGVASLGGLPILIWNTGHDWVTVRHVGGLAGLSEADAGIRWLGPATFVGTQFAVLLGYWFVAWAAALVAHRPWREPDPGLRYLWWTSVPMFGVFLAFSLRTGGGEPNWPVTAYVGGLVLAAGWLERQIGAPGRGYRWAARAGLATACVAGASMTVLLHHTEWAHPVMARLGVDGLRVRRLDPTCRLRGWRTLARNLDRMRDELRAEGPDPLLAGAGWSLPGEIGFYCARNPQAYSLGLPLGDRHSQYDWWRPNPVADPGAFGGRTFLVVGCDAPMLARLFDRVGPQTVVRHYEGGREISRWTVCVCRGYRGCPPEALARAADF
jgi:hypothetical protein